MKAIRDWISGSSTEPVSSRISQMVVEQKFEAIEANHTGKVPGAMEEGHDARVLQ